MYLNSVQIIGFIGKDPERRQARGNGAAFTVLSVATQRSWKNADDEWASKTEWHRVVAWNSLGERVAASLHRAITFWSRARSSAVATSANTAKARRPRPSSTRSGRFAPTRFAR